MGGVWVRVQGCGNNYVREGERGRVNLNMCLVCMCQYIHVCNVFLSACSPISVCIQHMGGGGGGGRGGIV